MNGDFTIQSEVWLQALSALQRVSKAGRTAASDVVMEFGCNELKLMYAGTAVAVPATGEGRGRALVSGKYIRPLAAVVRYLGPETIRVWAEGGQLHIGTTAIACEWVDDSPTSIQLPLNASLREILQLRYRYSQEQVASSGLAHLLFDAECQRAELVAQAAELLEPLGVSLPALDRLVSEAIKDCGN